MVLSSVVTACSLILMKRINERCNNVVCTLVYTLASYTGQCDEEQGRYGLKVG